MMRQVKICYVYAGLGERFDSKGKRPNAVPGACLKVFARPSVSRIVSAGPALQHHHPI
ncbi:protein of unknown function [Nitrospina watsonii]|uniref:Uncharacterized protein n=1 Tax=Nitrospina watsonii TaxID=1323948 RepID=A0ABM9HE85_9BACT|nr:protein of unknown function [Nitrospina watsonii]